MDLNNLEQFREIDKEKMIEHINGLPNQLQAAWELGSKVDLPDWKGIRKVLVAGMGGSAIGADLLAAYVQDKSSVPVIVHRDYDLPHWAKDEDTLVICSSYSGNTEETLTVFEQAQKADCRILAVSTGGTLGTQAFEAGIPLWRFDYRSQPRAALGYSFGLLLAAFTRLGFIPDPGEELSGSIQAMKEQQEVLVPEMPDTKNSSKRMAGQFYGRWVTLFGAGLMAPVAKRWKAQINENAKAQASFELLPEADHNTLQGVEQPEKEFGHTMALFLRAPLNHERLNMRDEFTRISMMVEGINTDFILGEGQSQLAQMWTVLHYGDYTSYYLAMAYGIDPTPVPMLVELKNKMKGE